MTVYRELYIRADTTDTAQILGSVGYLDSGLTREEIHKTSQQSDNYQNWRVRISPDNGRSFGAFEPLDWVNVQLESGGIATYPGVPQVDPATGIRYRSIMKRFWPEKELYTFDWSTHEHPFHDHVFVSEEHREGSSDDRSVEMRYERFDTSFDPEDPFQPGFLTSNRCYRGQSFCFDQNTRAYHPVVCRPSKYEYGHTRGGVVLMRRDPDGSWSPSNQRYVSPDVSSRGLLEPDAAVLNDGRILIVCRGSDTPSTEGRKWMTWSEDSGRTLEPIEEFRYASGKRFYSPSSIHRFFRSTKNGVLYWIGNISNGPPSGNNPRYPLAMGMIDEDRMGMTDDGVTVIDDRATEEPESLSLSNFFLLENRETLDLELYLTRHAAKSTTWYSSVYRYVIGIEA